MLWLALIPVAAGLLIKHSHTSPKQLIRNIKSWRPQKQLKHLKPTTASVFGHAEEEQSDADEDVEELRAKGQHRDKKFFWF